ncbi:MAG: Cyclic di-GMP binding protein [Deltaproteobacteria bacterium ADurb.Bin510]|nr:MAG: Cyclic di-GMP binding protein [Deltaproteobacteria bacterium ADurb.Bin510]
MNEQTNNHIERWKNHFAALPQLNLKLDEVDERLPALLLGQLPEKYLIVTKPRAVGIDQFIKPGAWLKVVHLFEGNVYGFETTILSHTETPSRLMFLSYPERIELVELRRHTRLNAHIPASLLCGDERHAGILWDLSRGGCPLEIYGTIRSLARSEGRLMVGIQFDEQRCGTRLKMIDDYVHQVLNALNED